MPDITRSRLVSAAPGFDDAAIVELQAVRDESRAVDADHARRSNALAESMARDAERAQAESEEIGRAHV